MAKYKWFRLYSEAASDPKLGFLSDSQFRIWFKLLCVASEQEDRGIIELDNFILSLKVSGGSEDDLSEVLKLLEKLKIIEKKENKIIFINFEARQYDNPSDNPEEVKKRVQKSRNNKKENRNDNETSCNDNETTTKQEETNSNAYSNSNSNTNTVIDNTIQDNSNNNRNSLPTTTFQPFSESPNENETIEEGFLEKVSDYYTHLTGRPTNTNDYISMTEVLNSDILPDFSVKLNIIKQCMSELCSKNGKKIHAFAYFSGKILSEFENYRAKKQPKQTKGGEPNGGFRPVPESFV